MILKLQHTHTKKPTEPSSQISDAFIVPLSIPNEHCPSFLKQLLAESFNELDKKSQKQILQSVKHRQKKVYEVFNPDNQIDCLAVMFQKANVAQQQYVKQMMGLREEIVMEKIVNSELEVREQQKNEKKIIRIKNQLDEKLKEMKKDLGDFANTSSLNIEQEVMSRIKNNPSLMVIQTLKKPKHWHQTEYTQQSKRIKSFLSRMKRQKSQVQHKYKQDLQSRFKKLQSQQQKQRQKAATQRQSQYMQNLQKQYKQRAQQRKEYFQRKKEKIKEISKFLEGVNNKEPVHVRYEKDFKDYLQKEEENRQRVLKAIKEKHPNYSVQEVQQHMARYEQHKQKYIEEKTLKQQLQEQILTKRYQEIKELYHSRHHKSLTNPRELLEKEHSELTNNRKKVQEYAKTVKQAYKPLIDQRKRREVEQNRKLLELSQDSRLRKVVKGGVIEFEQKRDSDAYEKGVSYLQQLRQINQVNRSRMSTSKRYEERSNSALQLSQSKKIDYLRQSRPSIQLKPTISDWKDLLQKKQFTPRDKLQRVLDRAQTLQLHAKQKEVQLRNMKRSQQALEVKQESDKYLMESVAARMVLLKDVVMK